MANIVNCLQAFQIDGCTLINFLYSDNGVTADRREKYNMQNCNYFLWISTDEIAKSIVNIHLAGELVLLFSNIFINHFLLVLELIL